MAAHGSRERVSMMPEDVPSAPLVLSELIDALDFVSASPFDEHRAYICKPEGRILFVADGMDGDDAAELPDDPEAAEYIAVPHRRDLDLGKRLALAFVAEELPGLLMEARDIFHRKGAYRRLKDLLYSNDALDRWYAYEERETEAAIRSWCEAVDLTLADDAKSTAMRES